MPLKRATSQQMSGRGTKEGGVLHYVEEEREWLCGRQEGVAVRERGIGSRIMR
jgi:hypothetical protein